MQWTNSKEKWHRKYWVQRLKKIHTGKIGKKYGKQSKPFKSPPPFFFSFYLDVKLLKRVTSHFTTVQYNSISVKITISVTSQQKSNDLNIFNYSFLPLYHLMCISWTLLKSSVSSLRGSWKPVKSRLFWAMSGWDIGKWGLESHVWWIIVVVRKIQLITT